MDESSILAKNNNYRCWRNPKENIYYNICQNQRSNLLLIIDNDSVIYYKINKESTNETTFLEFLKQFLKICTNFLLLNLILKGTFFSNLKIPHKIKIFTYPPPL